MKKVVKLKIIVEAIYDARYYEETDPAMIVEDVLTNESTKIYLDPDFVPVEIDDAGGSHQKQ
jgi:hypothetical protein